MKTPAVRWSIYALLFGFAVIAYVQRTTVSVAAPTLTRELDFSAAQLGWVFFAFTAAYAVAQLPGGVLGQRFGPRIMFFGIGLVGVVATLVTALAPFVATAAALFVPLVLAQALLGLGQGPIFPVVATALERWFPARQFALTNGLLAAGMLLGGALTPPLLVVLTIRFGWQLAIVCTALPAALLTLCWWWYGRDRPQQHPHVSVAELAALDDLPPAPPLTAARIIKVLRNPNILRLTMAYLAMNFVFYTLSFWSFFYLVEQRKLTGLESGFAAMVPWIGAAAGAAIGGVLGDRLVARHGARCGYRWLPMVSLPLAAIMLLAIPAAHNVALAVAALTLAFFAIEINEAPFWAATMNVARADAGAATGVLNTGGNVGGLLCQPLVAALVADQAWSSVWVMGAGFALLAAALWRFIDGERAAD